MLREPRVAGERRKQRAQPRVVGQQIVDQRRRFGYRGAHEGKKYLFLGFEIPRLVLIEEAGERGGALLQGRGPGPAAPQARGPGSPARKSALARWRSVRPRRSPGLPLHLFLWP